MYTYTLPIHTIDGHAAEALTHMEIKGKESAVRIKQEADAEREVVMVITDMVGYSRITSQMTPEEVRDFVIEYHHNMAEIIKKKRFEPVEIEPSAGDGALIVFGKRTGENAAQMCRRALTAAIDLAYAIEQERIASTRMGLFMGQIVEAQIGGKTAKFGTGFAAASRLEELCDYFGTSLLMDRDVAALQDEERSSLVNIGKVTPQNLSHPIHLLSVYKPGLHRIPVDVDRMLLDDFISLKNEAIDLFCGNEMLSLQPDFPKVREKLGQAEKLFQKMSGTVDLATERVLEYIRDTPYPGEDFRHLGMKIYDSRRDPLGVRLFHLSKELLKAIDIEFYNALVVETGWESCFALEWHNQGDEIITINQKADGIYYIDRGTVISQDGEGQVLATLGSGNIFGEMAYFSKDRRRNATVVAASDVVLRKISNADFEKYPVIQKIFKRIASRRQEETPVQT